MVNQQGEPVIPFWLVGHMRGEDLTLVSAAVRQVERTTGGEVVPMVVRRSIVTGHVFPMMLFLLAGIYATLIGLTGSAWGQPLPWWKEMWGFIFLVLQPAWLLSSYGMIQRLLTRSKDIELQIQRRAEAEFFRAGLHQTNDGTGILIFVSLLERHVVVLADYGISSRLPDATWQEVVKIITQSVHHGDMGKGFVQAINRCGELLMSHFPRQDQDQNELSDGLRILE